MVYHDAFNPERYHNYRHTFHPDYMIVSAGATRIWCTIQNPAVRLILYLKHVLGKRRVRLVLLRKVHLIRFVL